MADTYLRHKLKMKHVLGLENKKSGVFKDIIWLAQEYVRSGGPILWHCIAMPVFNICGKVMEISFDKVIVIIMCECISYGQ